MHYGFIKMKIYIDDFKPAGTYKKYLQQIQHLAQERDMETSYAKDNAHAYCKCLNTIHRPTKSKSLLQKFRKKI